MMMRYVLPGWKMSISLSISLLLGIFYSSTSTIFFVVGKVVKVKKLGPSRLISIVEMDPAMSLSEHVLLYCFCGSMDTSAV